MDPIIELDRAKLLLERREREVRQAAEYGLGLLEDNEMLQMDVATLATRLETETNDLRAQRDLWQQRTEDLQREVAQWKRKCARVEDEVTDLAEKFEHVADCCQCRGTNTTAAFAVHQLDTIAHLETELQDLYATEHSKEAELTLLRQWKQVAKQKHQEALASEALATQSEVSYRKRAEAERDVTQRELQNVKTRENQLRNVIQQFETEMAQLQQQLCSAKDARVNTLVHNKELREALLSSESRCQRFQRELALLEHVSYFAQASVDRDNEESDSDDESRGKEDVQHSVEHCNKPQCAAMDTGTDAENAAGHSLLKSKHSNAVVAATTEVDNETRVHETETQNKLCHYFHLTALSIIHENNLHERCFNSSSRVTLDTWYREVMARNVPYLLWHAWLITRISNVAASEQVYEHMPFHPSTLSPKSSPFTVSHGCLRRYSKMDDVQPSCSSPAPSAASPVGRVPFTVARAFFSLLRKSTHAGPSASLGRNVSVSASPAG